MSEEEAKREVLQWWIESYILRGNWDPVPSAKATSDGQWRSLPSAGPQPRHPGDNRIPEAVLDRSKWDEITESWRKRWSEWRRAEEWCNHFPYLVDKGLLRIRSKILLGNINAKPANLTCVVDWSGRYDAFLDMLHETLNGHDLWPESWNGGIHVTPDHWHVSHSLITQMDDPDGILPQLSHAEDIAEAVDILQAACEKSSPFTIELPEILYVADDDGKKICGTDINDLRTDIAANEIVYPYGLLGHSQEGSDTQPRKIAEADDKNRAAKIKGVSLMSAALISNRHAAASKNPDDIRVAKTTSKSWQETSRRKSGNRLPESIGTAVAHSQRHLYCVHALAKFIVREGNWREAEEDLVDELQSAVEPGETVGKPSGPSGI